MLLEFLWTKESLTMNNPSINFFTLEARSFSVYLIFFNQAWNKSSKKLRNLFWLFLVNIFLDCNLYLGIFSHRENSMKTKTPYNLVETKRPCKLVKTEMLSSEAFQSPCKKNSLYDLYRANLISWELRELQDKILFTNSLQDEIYFCKVLEN